MLDQNYSISQACRVLNIGATALKRWVDQLQFKRTGLSPTMSTLTAEQREIQQLKARIHQLEQEKIILKKATDLLIWVATSIAPTITPMQFVSLNFHIESIYIYRAFLFYTFAIEYFNLKKFIKTEKQESITPYLRLIFHVIPILP